MFCVGAGAEFSPMAFGATVIRGGGFKGCQYHLKGCFLLPSAAPHHTCFWLMNRLSLIVGLRNLTSEQDNSASCRCFCCHSMGCRWAPVYPNSLLDIGAGVAEEALSCHAKVAEVYAGKIWREGCNTNRGFLEGTSTELKQ